MTSKHPDRRSRIAFTLLEVVLTLSMAVVLMTLVGSTLSFYANNMTIRDTDVRQVHLATSLLQMIADDMRASLYGQSFDGSTLESFLTSAAGGNATQAAADPAAEDTLGTGTLSDPTLTDPALATDLGASTMTLTTPGMIGNQFQVQFDISRLPRMEQWTQTLSESPAEIADVPSDLKTVTYYVQPEGTVGGVIDPIQSYLPVDENSANATTSGGLVRRELDRAANNWATQSGGISGLLTTGELIATEVRAIEFEYFDGTLWQLFWNSDETQSMPKAIRILLTMNDTTVKPNADTGVLAATRTFTHTVMLPVSSLASTTQSVAPETATGTQAGTTTTTGATP